MRFFKRNQTNSRNPKLCPNCGYDSSQDDAKKTKDTGSTKEKVVEIDEEALNDATQAVVKETMKVMQPLLDKLQQANEELKQSQLAATQQIGNGFEQQIENMRNAAMERLKLQESRVAKRIGKLQSKIKQH